MKGCPETVSALSRPLYFVEILWGPRKEEMPNSMRKLGGKEKEKVWDELEERKGGTGVKSGQTRGSQFKSREENLN